MFTSFLCLIPHSIVSKLKVTRAHPLGEPTFSLFSPRTPTYTLYLPCTDLIFLSAQPWFRRFLFFYPSFVVDLARVCPRYLEVEPHAANEYSVLWRSRSPIWSLANTNFSLFSSSTQGWHGWAPPFSMSFVVQYTQPVCTIMWGAIGLPTDVAVTNADASDPSMWRFLGGVGPAPLCPWMELCGLQWHFGL